MNLTLIRDPGPAPVRTFGTLHWADEQIVLQTLERLCRVAARYKRCRVQAAPPCRSDRVIAQSAIRRDLFQCLPTEHQGILWEAAPHAQIRDGLLRRHAAKAHSLINTQVFLPSFPCELFQRNRAPIRHGHLQADALIIRLLGQRSPATVAGLITPVVVDSIQAGSGRPRSHVPVKGHEIAAPSLTHVNAATAIARKGFVRWAMTAGFGGRPRTIFRSHAGDRVPVRKLRSGLPQFPPQTATAFGVTGTQFLSFHGHESAAITFTEPTTVRCVTSGHTGCYLQRHESAKPLCMNINPMHGCMLA